MSVQKLKRQDLFTLEDYARQRHEFRARVMEHKEHRRLHVGPHLTLCFEDRLTIQYQVQEMLRTERIFEDEGIKEELAAYNPLIPDGTNWKATLLIEYADPAERARALARLVGIEHRVWMQVDELAPVSAIADEDLERATADKTSAVHFLRFELTPAMIAALKDGASISAGVDHPEYSFRSETLPELLRESLVADLD
jgi:hypothetical protein